MPQTNSKRLHPPENIDWISDYIDENKPQQSRNRLFFLLSRRPRTLAQNYATIAEQTQNIDNLQAQRKSIEKQQREIYADMLKEYGETEDYFQNAPLKQEEEKHKLKALEIINLNAFQTGIISRTKYEKERGKIDTERERLRRKYENIQQEELLWKGKFDRREEHLRNKFNTQLGKMDRRIEKVQVEIDELWGGIDDDVDWYRTHQDLSEIFGQGSKRNNRGKGENNT